MKRLIRYDFVGFLIASRIPNLLIIGATQYLTAFFLVSEYPQKLNQLTGKGFFMMVVSTVMIAAGGYIINDYYDQKIDMVNRPDKVVIGVLMRRRLALLAHFVLTFGAIALGFYLNPKIGVVHIFSSFFLWYYSNQLRRITIIGNVVIAFLTGLTLLMICIYLARNEVLVYIYASFAMAITLIREVLKDMEDVKGDSKFGIESLPVIFGIRGAKLFIYLSIGISGAFLISFLITIDNWWVRYYFMALLPIFLWFIYKLIYADRQKDYQRLIRFTDLIILSGLISMVLLKSWI
ncbi:geranylgeranylglycerol-phosphate geranylgeranyltransferase [Marinoscillum pacificum]|uniref:geranylgeranylglycerol-phosphate geranylgeranyltransferase n=1 Tax=Marinoscillum pacificum TaxID=392723 RepID=UPI002157B7DE|nr:geranylgeranylglycerol-phosphate geranylgeranyltransferase [Marinoscillum pacificum]